MEINAWVGLVVGGVFAVLLTAVLVLLFVRLARREAEEEKRRKGD